MSSLVFTPNYSTFLAFVDIDETGNRTFYSLSNGVNDASLRGFTLNDVDKQMLLETRIFILLDAHLYMIRPALSLNMQCKL